MPAVLIELGFMNNQNEILRCIDSNDQLKKAQAIADTVKSMY